MKGNCWISDFVFTKIDTLSQRLIEMINNGRQGVRMDKGSFRMLVRIISSLFNNKSRIQQTPVWIQCLVVFRRLGCHGNANSLGMNGRTYGFSEGAVVLFVKRVLLHFS